MKLLLALLLALAASSPLAKSQEPLLDEEPSLIPEIPAPGPRPNTPATRTGPEVKSSTEKASDNLLARIRFRTVKTKALQSPAVQDEWTRAHQVKTDRERREGLQNYYRLLYDRMIKLDPTLTKSVQAARKSAIARIEARRGGRGKGKTAGGRVGADESDESENN